MKVHHVVKRALKSPKPEKIYGARVVGLTLNSMTVTVEWAIFGRKNRKRKSKPAKTAKEIK